MPHPQNSYVENPNPQYNTIVFGDLVFKHVALEEVRWVGPNPLSLVSLKERKYGHRGQAMGGLSTKSANCKPRRETSGETKAAGTWVSDFHPPTL